MLNGNQKIKKIAEKYWYVFVLKKKTEDGQALQKIKKTGQNKYVQAEKPDLFIGEQEQASSDDEYPDNKFGSAPA